MPLWKVPSASPMTFQACFTYIYAIGVAAGLKDPYPEEKNRDTSAGWKRRHALQQQKHRWAHQVERVLMLRGSGGDDLRKTKPAASPRVVREETMLASPTPPTPFRSYS